MEESVDTLTWLRTKSRLSVRTSRYRCLYARLGALKAAHWLVKSAASDAFIELLIINQGAGYKNMKSDENTDVAVIDDVYTECEVS